MREFALVVVYNHTWQLIVDACMRNKFPCKSEMSTYNCYKSCWRWSVSQFSTCMRLLRHGCQRHSFWYSQTESQMHTFPDQMNSHWFVPDIYGVQIPVKTSCAGQRWSKTKEFFVFCSGEIVMVFVLLLSVICPLDNLKKCLNSHHSYPLHPFITWIFRECKVQNGLIL